MKRLRQLLAALRELPRALIHLPVVITLVLGLLVTATLFMAIRTFEQERIQADFHRRAGNRVIAVTQGLADAVDALATVNRLFVTMQPVTRAQFATFVAPILKRSPQLRLIVYQRLVAARERAAFEAERGVGMPGFAITTLADGKLMKAPARAQYRVVDYLVPTAGNEAAFGLDAASRSEQDDAIRRSCETGAATMTNQYDVMLANGLHPGFQLLMPVYRAGAALDPRGANCALVTGYTAVVISSAALIEKTLAGRGLLGTGEFDIRVYAEHTGKQPDLVFQAGGGRRAAASPLAALFAGPARHAGASFEVAGHQWQIAIDAGHEPSWLASLGSLLMLASGIAGSFLAAAYIGVMSARTRSVFRLVRDRTAALTLASRSQQLLRQAVDACFNSIIIIRAEAPGYPIEYVNPAVEKMTGYSAAEMAGRPCSLLWGADAEQPGVQDVIAMVRERREGTAVLCICRKDGGMLWTEVYIAPVKDASGAVTHFVAVHSDVTEKRGYEAELEFQATHDALTGLANRKLLSERLRQEIAGAQRHKQGMWVLFVDLDRFKFVNDSVGHHGGDECLQAIAQRLAAAVRPQDTVARLGGDEFMLVLSERGDGHLSYSVLDRIMQAVARPLTVGGQDFFLSCSLGVASYPRDSDDPDTLIEYADLAMYRAKQHGRANYQFYQPEMNQQAQERVHLETALRNALERREFELHFQPQLDLRSGAIVGVEALLRWRHPELGLLTPQRFLALAEDTGLIVPIGAWAMRSACAQVRSWQLDGHAGLRLALNLAGREFNEPDLVSKVALVLDDTGLPANCLELELTERMMMSDVERAVATLADLRKLGVSVAVDDFGTGYSSLGQLKNFPLAVLKIDQSFVRTISAHGNDAAIPHAIIALAHNLGMRVIAEGVETEAQCEFLARNMCDEIQGNLFSPALDAAAVEALLAAGRKLPPHLLRMHKRERTLLLVDDEPNILSALKRQLRGSGLRILTAPGGKEGLALLESEAVDVIVSDQRMPGMTGVDFLRAVKTSHPDTVRIVLSGFTELQSVTDAVNEGAIYKFLTKPWDDTQLRGHIQEAMLHKEMADENRRLDLEVRTANHGLAQANRQLEAVLRQQQEQIDRTGISLDIVREALQHVPLPILGLDDEQVVAFANLAAQQLFGQDGMQLGSSAELFMEDLLLRLEQGGEGRGCVARLHGSRFDIAAHAMGNGTRSRGRLIIFNPAPATVGNQEPA
jgi:diguanylate cyclase (GGDEF)-like protein/PAS domain S-box-containing protein